MIRRALTAVLAVTVVASLARAQAPARLRWKAGQVLVYRSEQTTSVIEVVGGTKVETSVRLHLTKCWRVKEVDPTGVATVEQSLRTLMQEITPPSGTAVRYDSAIGDKNPAELRKQFDPYIGQTLAVLRVDAQGRVVEVKESKFGPASKYDNELPFGGMLPAEALKPGLTWDRTYQMTLAPPAGTGEKYEAVQHYKCKAVDARQATVALATEVKSLPAAVGDRIPLLQLQNEGELVYDLEAGRLSTAALQIDKELKGHQGEGSSYHFKSEYKESYVGGR